MKDFFLIGKRGGGVTPLFNIPVLCIPQSVHCLQTNILCLITICRGKKLTEIKENRQSMYLFAYF